MRLSKQLLVMGVFLALIGFTSGMCSFEAESAQGEIDLEKGLVAYWSFNGGVGNIAFDESGNYADAGLLCTGEDCSSPKWVVGKIGMALEFDGVDDYVYCGIDASLDFGAGDFTLVAWVNSRVLDRGVHHQYIISEGWGDMNVHKGYGFGFIWEATYWHYTLQFGIGDGYTGAKTPYVNPAYFDSKSGEWFHVVAQRQSNTICIYLDGEKWSSANASSVGDISVKGSLNDSFYVGNFVANKQLAFEGIIDEVRIYNRALSEDEIRFLYGLDSGR